MIYSLYGGDLEYVNIYRALSDTDALPNLEYGHKQSLSHGPGETVPYNDGLYEHGVKPQSMPPLPSPQLPSEPVTCEWPSIAKPIPTYNQGFASPVDMYENESEAVWACNPLFGLDAIKSQSPEQLLGEPALSDCPEAWKLPPVEPSIAVGSQPTEELHRKPPVKAAPKKKTRRCRKQYGTIYDDFGNEIVDPVKRSRKRIAMLIEEDNVRRKYEEEDRVKIAAARIQRAERRAKAHGDPESHQKPDSSIPC